MIFFLLIQHIQSEGRFYVPPVLLSSYHPLFKSLPLLPIMSQLLRPSGDVLLFHTSLIISVGLWVHEGGLVMVRYCSFLFILSFMGFSLCQIPHVLPDSTLVCPGAGVLAHSASPASLHPPLTHLDYLVKWGLSWPFVISHTLVDLFPQQVKVPQ